MAVTQLADHYSLGLNIVRDSDCDSTSVDNPDGGASTLHTINIDSANAAITYLNIWCSTQASGAPDMRIPCAANGDIDLLFLGGLLCSSGFTFSCTTDKDDAPTTDPATPPVVMIRTNGGE